MDVSDIQVRAQNLVMRVATATGDTAPEVLLAEVTEIVTALEGLADTVDDGGELRDLAQALNMMAEPLRDPDSAAALFEFQSASYEPDPPIFDAIKTRDIAELKRLLETVDVNARYGEYDATALYRALSSMDGISEDVVTVLLDAGADPNLGLTHTNVLHGLGFSNPRDITADKLAPLVMRCVALGADIEQRTEHLMWTPLLGAASEWNEVAVEALLMAGADITARAGDVDGVCFAGQDAFAMADGHPVTLAVLNSHKRPQ